MPTTTYFPDPTGAERHHADKASIVFGAGTGTANVDAQSIFDVGNSVFFDTCTFLRLRLTDIPAEAQINSATLRMFTRAPLAVAVPSVFSLLTRDGAWDDISAAPLWNAEALFDVAGQLIASDFTVQAITTTSLAGSSGFPINTDNEVIEAGQAFSILSTKLCLGLQLGLKRIGNPTGNVRVRLERCIADDGSNDRPDGTAIATSLNVAASSISNAANGALTTFQFMTLPALSVGQRYCCILEVEYPEATTTNYVELRYIAGDFFTGSLVARGERIGFNTLAYLSDQALPFLRHPDLTTPYHPAFAGLEIDANIPPLSNAVWHSQDVTSLVQAWVNDPSYAENDVIGFHIFPDVGGTPGEVAFFDNFELVIDWEPTNIWSRVDSDSSATTEAHWCHPYSAGAYADDPSNIEYDPDHIAADPAGICGDAQQGWTSKDAPPATTWTRVDDE